MIRIIKNKIKNFADDRVKLIKNQQRLNQQINFNYNQISQLFKEESFIPFSTWAISPSTILHVLNDITINNRKSIIEFGAGSSTFYIAKLLKVMEIKAEFYTVESDKKWIKDLQRQLKIYKIDEYVTIIYAPISNVPKEISYKDQSKWYNTEILNSQLKDCLEIDLVLVDGPFGGSTPYARYSALPYLKNKISSDASIYLDDVDRIHEKEIALNWQELYEGKIRYIERYMLLTKKEEGFDVAPFQLQDITFK